MTPASKTALSAPSAPPPGPVSRVNPGYPGPKQAGPDGERLRLKDGALYDEALKYCINCKRCEVMPVRCEDWRYYPARAGEI